MNQLDVEHDRLLAERFEHVLATKLELSAKNVTPDERRKLAGLLKYYAKKRHPFRACVRDNTKRFGPDGAKRICATLKDIIRGTTRWRGKNNPRDKGAPGIVGLNEDYLGPPEIDERLASIIEELSELDLYELLDLAALDDD